MPTALKSCPKCKKSPHLVTCYVGTKLEAFMLQNGANEIACFSNVYFSLWILNISMTSGSTTYNEVTIVIYSSRSTTKLEMYASKVVKFDRRPLADAPVIWSCTFYDSTEIPISRIKTFFEQIISILLNRFLSVC